MIGTIRKHSKWLWLIIIFVVIVTFVFWGSQPSGRLGREGGEFNPGSINGEPIKLEAFVAARHEAMLRYRLNNGDWPDNDPNAKRMNFDLERDTYYRLLLLQKQRDLQIHVSDETVAKVAAEILRNWNGGNPVSIDQLEKQLLHPKGMSMLDFENFVRHDLGIQQLMSVNSVGGRLVTPQEARLFYEREHEELATEAVFFNATNYLAGVTVTPEAVSQFFTNQMPNYRLPDRVQVSYVAFEVSNYLAQSEAELVKTNLTEMIDANYARLGTNYNKEAKTPEEAKTKIRAELIASNARPKASRAANDFATAVMDLAPKQPDNLAKLAAERKLTLGVTAPFDVEEGPKEFVVLADFMKEAFALTAEEPIAGPIAGRDAVYVIALKGRLPSEIPAFETIREKVTADYQRAQAVLAARKAGEDFARTLTNGLAGGGKFTSLCLAAGVKPALGLPPISLSTREAPEIEAHTVLYQYKQAAFTTKPGQASGFVSTIDGGFVVFVRERLPLDLTKLTAELPAYLDRIRTMRQNEAFNEWFSKEAERGLRNVPYFRKQQPQLTGPLKK